MIYCMLCHMLRQAKKAVQSPEDKAAQEMAKGMEEGEDQCSQSEKRAKVAANVAAALAERAAVEKAAATHQAAEVAMEDDAGEDEEGEEEEWQEVTSKSAKKRKKKKKTKTDPKSPPAIGEEGHEARKTSVDKRRAEAVQKSRSK